MALVKCEHCGEQIAGNAEHCPKCGGIYTRKGWKRSDIISAIQATISGISAIIALGVLTYYFSQYRTTENWKKREFVATQIKEFHSDKINEAVLLMLDYDPARIELFPDRKEIGDRYVDVSFETLVAAVNKEKKYTEIEFEVRKFFEHFLNSLSRFNYYISYDAIHPAELCTELGYPIGILSGNEDVRKMKMSNNGWDITPFSTAVSKYLNRWHDEYVLTFMKRINDACP